jgi:hypothetical protein
MLIDEATATGATSYFTSNGDSLRRSFGNSNDLLGQGRRIVGAMESNMQELRRNELLQNVSSKIVGRMQ